MGKLFNPLIKYLYKKAAHGFISEIIVICTIE